MKKTRLQKIAVKIAKNIADTSLKGQYRHNQQGIESEW